MKIERLEFKAGPKAGSTAISVDCGQIVFFIGPNNGGKTAALNEIYHFLYNLDGSKNIFRSIKVAPLPESEIDEKMQLLVDPLTLNGPNVAIGSRHAGSQQVHLQGLIDELKRESGSSENYRASMFYKHFAINLDGHNRLNLTRHVSNQNLRDKPSTTLGAIFKDNALRRRISEVVHAAFGKHLLIDATSMSNLSYVFCDEQPSVALERSFDDDAIEFFAKCDHLANSSDGTKAFIGILTEVMAGSHDIMLIDEPEAFLHPGLAYLLGREVAQHIAGGRQLFVSTHSPHFLMGCLSVGVDTDIVRLTYKSKFATARHISKATLRPMMHDPLLKSIGVMNSLFYESAVVTEADADRAFYQEINSRLISHGNEGVRHAEFLNAHNKTEAANIAQLLRSVGIPAAIILDIDWIKEDGTVATKYFDAVGIPEGARPSFLELRRTVRRSLENKHEKYKLNGGIRLLEGAELATAQHFFRQMRGYGLFTVENGELEHWLPNLEVNVRKDRWLSEIFARLGSDPGSPEYVKPDDDDVWEVLRAVKGWITDPKREGMDFVPE